MYYDNMGFNEFLREADQIRERYYNEPYRSGARKRLAELSVDFMQEIMHSDNLTPQEQVKLIDKVKTTRYNYLNRSLFNLILMQKNGLDLLPTQYKVASIKNLLKSGMVYETVVLANVEFNGVLLGQREVRVLKLTAYGEANKEEALKMGIEHIEKQKKLFEKLGF